MATTNIVLCIIFAVIAAALGGYTAFTARCKGPILSNPWIWMGKEEKIRELAKVDIKAEYRQLTIVFGGLALAFGYLSAFCIFSYRLPLYPMWILCGLIVIYAIVSSLKFVTRGSGR
ncbi:MAG: hypothetical protein FWH17_05670 [Oscillospiraceae bacterium]|nr:hypothetical protein [Oscillospiraceae bacterium]